MADHYPDVLHSYYSVCWLAMTGYEGFASIDCALGMTCRARDELDRKYGREAGLSQRVLVPI
jgi:prenyltransferase beta subunit